MAEGKNTIIFYRDWKEIFESLNDKDCAELIRHIFRYVNDENPETQNEIVKAVFIPIKNSLKRDLKKWESIRLDRRKAGLASAEARKQSQQVLTDVDFVEQTPTNPTVSVTVTDTDSDSVNIEGGSKGDKSPIGDGGVNFCENKKSWKEDYEVYKAQLREAYLHLVNDNDWIKQQETYHPNVDIRLSIDKACVNFWATEAGWIHKKKKRAKDINWKTTLTNAISMNKVYKQKSKNEY